MKENYLNLLELTNEPSALFSLYEIMKNSHLFKKDEVDNLYQDKILSILENIVKEQKKELDGNTFKLKYREIIKCFPDIFESIKDKFYNELMTNEFFLGANLFYLEIVPHLLDDILENKRSFNEKDFLYHVINISNLKNMDYINTINPSSFKQILEESSFYYAKITNLDMINNLIERNIITSENIEDLITKSDNKNILSWVKEKHPDLINTKESNMEFEVFISKIKKEVLTIKKINELSENIKDFEDRKFSNNKTFYHAIILKNIHYLNTIARKNPKKLKELLSQKDDDGLTPVDYFIEKFNFRTKVTISEELICVMNDIGLSKNKKYKIGWNDFNKTSHSHAIFNIDPRNNEISYLLLNMKNMEIELDIHNAVRGEYQFSQMASVMIKKILDLYDINNLEKIFKPEDILYMNFYKASVINEVQKEKIKNNLKEYLDLYLGNKNFNPENLFKMYDSKYKSKENQDEDFINFSKTYYEKKQIEMSMNKNDIEKDNKIRRRI